MAMATKASAVKVAPLQGSSPTPRLRMAKVGGATWRAVSVASTPVSSVGALRRRVAAAARIGDGTTAEVTDAVQLGRSGIAVSALGIGAWSWGDRSGYWGYGNGYDKSDTLKAYEASRDAAPSIRDHFLYATITERLPDDARMTNHRTSKRSATARCP